MLLLTFMNIKLFVAIPSEFPPEYCPETVELFYTGVGKVNAAIRATQVLLHSDPANTIVMNYGSAGSNIHPIHSLLRCRKFQQADIDGRPLVCDAGITPFDSLIYPQLATEIISFGEDGHLCTTQDQFQQKPIHEINDMEVYSIAKVCKIMGFDFVSYKFISDGGDAHDWEDNHHLGIEAFLDVLKKEYKH